ncbi:MAG: hypothetical protein NTY75_02225 [Candidatus Shapirobacteria bacterium]|nr:hypothetical protein [Candidatus Shapirobacteria bacterium]
MKEELRRHFTPLLIIFAVTSIFWIFAKTPWYNFVYLFFGLAWGAFLLDVDHLIYWLYLNPNTEESRLAQIAYKKSDFISLLKLLESTHKQHISLIFHHYFFQVVLAIISIFVFTSSSNIFIKGLILSLNIHLLVDEIEDYRSDKKHLQNWLFARESKQLSVQFLGKYIIFFAVLCFIFTLLLIKSY